MVLQLETEEEIFNTLVRNTAGETADLTNFTDNSPEATELRAIARYEYRKQHGRLAAQLSAWPRYAGGPLSEEDLEGLYTDPADAEPINRSLLNSLLADFDLDQLGAANSVARDPGARAQGTVLVTLSSEGATVEAGALLATVPDATGDYLSYRVTEDATAAANSVTVEAPIEALERGPEHNVGSNRIEHVPSEQAVDTSQIAHVTNPDSTSGGEGEEENGPYRQRIMSALTSRSGGGTVGGIEGEFTHEEGGIDGVDEGDVRVIQHHDGQPVIPETDGAAYSTILITAPQATDSEIQALVDRDDVTPSGIYHEWRRADRQVVDVELTVAGVDVETAAVRNAVARYLAALTLGEDVVDSRISLAAHRADEDVESVDFTLVVDQEPHTYTSGTAQYALDTPAPTVRTVTGTSGGTETTFAEGTDYALVDTGSDGVTDTIDWSVGGAAPDDGTTFTVTYEALDDVHIASDEVADPGEITLTNPDSVED